MSLLLNKWMKRRPSSNPPMPAPCPNCYRRLSPSPLFLTQNKKSQICAQRKNPRPCTKIGVADMNPALCAEFRLCSKFCSQNISFLYQFVPITLFVWESKFLPKVKLQTGTPLLVRNVVLACNYDSGMQYFLTVQVYTTWRHPGLSFVNETSLTIRCLRRRRRRRRRRRWITICWSRPSYRRGPW